MIESRYYVEPANWEADETDLRDLRERVFMVEQQVSREDEWDGLDPECVHVLARSSENRQPIGTGRMTADGKIGRMAVLPEWRNQGVGGAMLQALLDLARERHMSKLQLHAQLSAISFYQRHGFKSEGEEFSEASIRHRKMVLHLPYPEPIARVGAEPSPETRVSRLLTTDGVANTREALCALLERARHELCIYSRDLEPTLYDVEQVITQVRRIALSGARARVRILVQEPTRAALDGHRLVQLSQRLSTAISIRKPHVDDLQYNSAFILNDCNSYLFRSLADRYEGEGDLYHPPRSGELQRYFDAVWERATAVEEFRRLSI